MGLRDHLDKISAFVTIAQTGKLSEAAKRLHLSQPSLTRLIQTLEHACGTELFHRSRQGVVLTPAGSLLLVYATSALAGLGDLEERLKNPGLESSGLLQIGSYESLAEYLWPEFLVDFRKTTPELKIAIRTSNSSGHQSALERGELDVLVDAEPRLVGDFTSWRLYDDHFRFYGVGKKIPSSLDPSSIASIPLIFCPSAFDKDNKGIVQHLEERGYFFKEKMELDSFPAVKTFCQHGMGLGVLPRRLAEDHSAARSLVQIALKGIPATGIGPHSIYATVRSSRASDARIGLLVKELRRWFKAGPE